MHLIGSNGQDKILTRFDSLTGLRAILAIMVVFCHGCIRCDLFDDGSWISKLVGEMGHSGVTGFFVLSGYILAHVYRNRKYSLSDFAVNRFARIYPLYLLGLAFTLPIDWLSPGMDSAGRAAALSLSTLLLQSWLPFSNGRFNGPGWTLSVEMLFYILFPVLFVLWKKNVKAFTGITILCMFFTAILWNPTSFFLSHRFPPLRIWEFMFGMLLATIPLKPRWLTTEILPLCLIVSACIAAAFLDNVSFSFLKWFWMALLNGAAIYLLAARDSAKIRKSFFASKWMILGGELSYGVYLLHDGIQRYARVGAEYLLGISLKDSSLSFKCAFLVITTSFSILVAFHSWKQIETPARKLLRRKLNFA